MELTVGIVVASICGISYLKYRVELLQQRTTTNNYNKFKSTDTLIYQHMLENAVVEKGTPVHQYKLITE